MTKTVSASTLARRAAKTKNPAAAKRLRAQAAKLRREQRGAKKPRPMTGLPDREKIIKRVNQRIDEGKFHGIVAGLDPRLMQPDEAANDGKWSINQARAASVDSMPLTEQPGRGEIVGGYLATKADTIARLARKKGGVDAIQAQLSAMVANIRAEAYDETSRDRADEIQKNGVVWREKIVCAFVARMATEASQPNKMPSTLIVDGVTLAMVRDALQEAGYYSYGRRLNR